MRFATRLGVCGAVLCALSASRVNGQFGRYFDLRELDGTNAKRFMGELRNSCTGAPATVGDVNGDGLLDLIFAAPCWGIPGPPYPDELPGTVYVVFGGPWFDQVVSVGVEELDGTNGFAIEGPEPDAFFGLDLVSGFDWNGDGIDDLAAGAAFVRVGPNNDAGQVFVIFGRPDIGATGSFDLASLDGTNGFVIDGIALADYLGWALAAGDFNADAWPDLAMGADGFTLPGRRAAGRVFVIFGGPGVGSSGSFDLHTLDGTNGFVANGIAAGDLAAWDVANAGDLNDDGFDDLATGALQADPGGRTNAGQCYVLFGGPALGARGVFELADLNGTNGLIINGPAPDARAYRVSAAGDVNGDGIADLFVGHERGAAVIFGGPDVRASSIIDMATLGWATGVVLSGRSGHPGAGVGDINDDGLADVAVARKEAYPEGRYEAGVVKVVFGKPELGMDGPVNVNTLDGTNGFYIYGDQRALRLGVAYPLGDLNRDGIRDFGLYGEYDRPDAPPGGWNHGALYVIFGRSRLALGDFDRDGDVDLDDFGVFAACCNGSMRPPAPSCPEGIDADLDNDGDVDLDDFGIFATNFTGAM